MKKFIIAVISFTILGCTNPSMERGFAQLNEAMSELVDAFDAMNIPQMTEDMTQIVEDLQTIADGLVAYQDAMIEYNAHLMMYNEALLEYNDAMLAYADAQIASYQAQIQTMVQQIQDSNTQQRIWQEQKSFLIKLSYS